MVYPYFIRGFLGISLIVFLFTESDKLRAWSVFLFVLFFILVVHNRIYLIRRPRKLEKILNEIGFSESLVDLKKSYNGLYNLHCKLSSKHQEKYASRLNEVRERIERKLKAGKKIEELLQVTGSLEVRKKNYEEMFEIYQKLPREIQKEYYAKIMHVKEGLENG